MAAVVASFRGLTLPHVRQSGALGFAPKVFDLPAITFLMLVAALYFYVWATSGVNSRMGALGWNGWSDQSYYLKSAIALAHGNLQASQHWYPLGYPLLGVPFVYVTPDEPFFFPNLALLLGFCLLYLLYFRPLIGVWLAATAFFASTALPFSVQLPQPVFFPLFLQFVVPWNSTPVAACIMALLVLARDYRNCNYYWPDFWAGLLAGYVLITRPSDLLPIAIAGGFFFIARLQTGNAMRRAFAMFVGGAAIVVPVGGLFFAIHGSLFSEYTLGAASVGFGFSNLSQRFYAVFVDASAIYGVPLSIFVAQPWLTLLAPLAMAWAMVDIKNGLLPVVCATASALTYLAFNDFSPLTVFKYFLIHYIVWIFPIVTAGAIAGVVLCARRRWFWMFGFAILPVIAIALIKLIPETVGVGAKGDTEQNYRFIFSSREEVDAIDLVGATTTAPYGGTIERIGLRADAQELPLYGGYRMFPINGGMRILFDTKVRASNIEVDLPASVQLPQNESPVILATKFVPILRFGWPPDMSMLATISRGDGNAGRGPSDAR